MRKQGRKCNPMCKFVFDIKVKTKYVEIIDRCLVILNDKVRNDARKFYAGTKMCVSFN